MKCKGGENEKVSKGRKAALIFQKVCRIDKHFASTSCSVTLGVPPKEALINS